MSYWHCDDSHEHKRQGARDFERNGKYGYDDSFYHGHDVCTPAYREGFDEAKQEHDRNEEYKREHEERDATEERRIRAQRTAQRDQDEQEEDERRQRADEASERESTEPSAQPDDAGEHTEP